MLFCVASNSQPPFPEEPSNEQLNEEMQRELRQEVASKDVQLKQLHDRLDEMTERNERLQHELELLCNTRERVPSSGKINKKRKNEAQRGRLDQQKNALPSLEKNHPFVKLWTAYIKFEVDMHPT